MKNLIKKTYIILIALTLFGTNVFATVGGETRVTQFVYNPNDESIYYVQTDGSGKGCPPELKKIALENYKVETLVNCDDNINNSQSDSFGYDLMSDLYQKNKNLKQLVPLDLASNDFKIEIQHLSTKKIEEVDEVAYNNFSINLFQAERKVHTFDITGCDIGQPFVITGYRVPGFNKKIVILITNISNCFEGGYANDKLVIVPNVDISNLKENLSLRNLAIKHFHKGSLVGYSDNQVQVDVEGESLGSQILNFFKNLFK